MDVWSGQWVGETPMTCRFDNQSFILLVYNYCPAPRSRTWMSPWIEQLFISPNCFTGSDGKPAPTIVLTGLPPSNI